MGKFQPRSPSLLIGLQILVSFSLIIDDCLYLNTVLLKMQAFIVITIFYVVLRKTQQSL